MQTQFFAQLALLSQCFIFVKVFQLSRKNGTAISEASLCAFVISTFGVYELYLISLFFQFGIQFAFTFITAIGILALCSITRPQYSDLPSLKRFSNETLGLLVLGLFTFLHFSIGALKSEISYDGLLYHGPALAQMISKDSLFNWNPISQYSFYPDLAMVAAIPLAKITGTIRFDDTVQVQSFVLCILVGYCFLKNRVSNVLLRFAVPICAASATVVWLQTRVMYSDLFYSSALLAAIYLILIANNSTKMGEIAALVALAAVLSSKPAGIIPVIILSLILIFRTVFSTTKRSLLVFIPSLFISILVGSIFYIRNFLEFGNPFFPIRISLFGLQLNGPVDGAIFRDHPGRTGLDLALHRVIDFIKNLQAGMSNGVTKLDYDPRIGGFGFLPWIIVALLALFVVQKFSSKSRTKFQFTRNDLLLLICSFFILVGQPSNLEPRYVITCYFLVIFIVFRVFPIKLFAFPFAIMLILSTFVQVAWNETRVFAGAKSMTSDSQSLPDQWKPNTSGSIFGTGDGFAYLQNENCNLITVQTEGGVGNSGMMEGSRINALSYGLYGPRLCNKLNLISSKQLREMSISNKTDFLFRQSEVLILYSRDQPVWTTRFPETFLCFDKGSKKSGDSEFPIEVTIFLRIGC